MRRAVGGCAWRPAKVLVDGNQLPRAARAGRGDRRRRRQGAVDLGRVDPRQGAPRPAAARAARRASAVRLRQPQGLRDAGAPGGAAPARRLRAPPAQLRAGARGARHFGPAGAGQGDLAVRGRRFGIRCLRSTDQFARQPAAREAAQAGARPGRLPQGGPGLARGRAPVRGRAGSAACKPRRRWSPSRRWADAGRAGAGSRGAPRVAIVPDALFAGLSRSKRRRELGLSVCSMAGGRWIAPGVAERGARPPAGCRQRRQHPAQRGGVRLHAGDRARGHGRAVVAEGAARRRWARTSRCGWSKALALAALDALAVPLLGTSSHAGASLPGADLPLPCAWVFGHEGQGVAADLLAPLRADACASRSRAARSR